MSTKDTTLPTVPQVSAPFDLVVRDDLVVREPTRHWHVTCGEWDIKVHPVIGQHDRYEFAWCGSRVMYTREGLEMLQAAVNAALKIAQ